MVRCLARSQTFSFVYIGGDLNFYGFSNVDMSDEPQPSWEHERESDSSSDDQELLELAEQIRDGGESDLHLHFQPSVSESEES